MGRGVSGNTVYSLSTMTMSLKSVNTADLESIGTNDLQSPDVEIFMLERTTSAIACAVWFESIQIML